MPQMVSVSYDILDRQHAPLRSTDVIDQERRDSEDRRRSRAQTWRTADG